MRNNFQMPSAVVFVMTWHQAEVECDMLSCSASMFTDQSMPPCLDDRPGLSYIVVTIGHGNCPDRDIKPRELVEESPITIRYWTCRILSQLT